MLGQMPGQVTKKVIGYVYLTGSKLFGNRIAPLVYKAKGLYIAYYRQFAFPVVGTSKQEEPEAGYQNQEEDGVNRNAHISCHGAQSYCVPVGI